MKYDTIYIYENEGLCLKLKVSFFTNNDYFGMFSSSSRFKSQQCRVGLAMYMYLI